VKKNLTITLSVDAKTGKVTAVRNSFDNLDRKVKETDGNIKKLAKTVAKGFAFGYIVHMTKQLIHVADEMKNLHARIGLVTHSTAQLNAVQAELFNVSQSARVGLADVAGLYTQIARSAKDTAYTHKDLIGITKTLTKTLTISGSSAESANAALVQLSQGLASGTLRGEALNSIMEQTPRLAQAIADGMGVSIGQLRALGAEGKLTTQTVLEAIQKQGSAIDAEFAKMPITVGQAMTQAHNAFLGVIAGIDEATGATEGLANMVSDAASFISAHVDDIAQGFLGIKLVFNVLDVAFWTIVTSIDSGIETIGQAWYTMTAGLHNAFKASVDAIGNAFYDMVNDILGLLSKMINSVSGALGGVFDRVGIDNPFGKVNLDIGEYVSSIKEAKVETFKLANTDWAQSKLKSSVEEMNKTYTTLTKGVHVAKKANEALLHTRVKGGGTTAGIRKDTKALKEAAAAAKKYEDALKNARAELRKARLYNAGGEELVRMGELGDKLASLGKYLKQSELAEIYDAEIKKMNRSTDSFKERLADAFDIETGSIGEKLFGSLWDGLQSFASSFKGNDPFAVSNATGDLIASAADALLPGSGTAIKMWGAMWSQTLSEAEIVAAAGRSEFDSKGTKEIVGTLKEYMQPQLTHTKSMLQHLESMDNNLIQALNATAGLDLGGSTFTPKTSSVLGGVLFASSTELIGSGIHFYDQAVSGFVQGVEADGYKSIKKSSSFLGIFTSESIKESLQDLPDGVKKQIGEAFNHGLQSAFDGLDMLGFDTSKLKARIDDYVVSLGKINFKDLSIEEQAKALNQALTQELNNAITDGLQFTADPKLYYDLQRFATAGEEITGTIARVSVGFETVATSLGALGVHVETFNQSQGLIDAAGGLSEWKTAQDAFIGMLSSSEQKQYYQNMLQTALATYNVALPASKAQFIALKKETEAKIVALRAQIATMETELAAKVQAGEISLQVAYGEYEAKVGMAKKQADVINQQVKNNNYLIASQNKASQASVAFGNSLHKTVKAIATGSEHAESVSTQNENAAGIDYDRLHSPELDAARARLKELEGLYGTLMSNMGDFASYYGNTESAASGAASAMESLNSRLVDLANFKKQLGADAVSIAKYKLRLTTKETGLDALTIDNILSSVEKNLKKLTDVNDEASKRLFENYKKQYSALKELDDAMRAHRKQLLDTKVSIFEMQGVWGGVDNSAKIAKERLAYTIKETGLAGVTAENFLSELNKAVAAGADEKTIKKYKQLSDALQGVQSSLKNLAKGLYDLQAYANKELRSFGIQTANQIGYTLQDAINRADYSEAKTAFGELVKQTKDDSSLTYKEKIFQIARANKIVQDIPKKDPNADIVKGLELLRKENEALRREQEETNKKLDAIEKHTYRTQIAVDNEYNKVVGQ